MDTHKKKKESMNLPIKLPDSFGKAITREYHDRKTNVKILAEISIHESGDVYEFKLTEYGERALKKLKQKIYERDMKFVVDFIVDYDEGGRAYIKISVTNKGSKISNWGGPCYSRKEINEFFDENLKEEYLADYIIRNVTKDLKASLKESIKIHGESIVPHDIVVELVTKEFLKLISKEIAFINKKIKVVPPTKEEQLSVFERYKREELSNSIRRILDMCDMTENEVIELYRKTITEGVIESLRIHMRTLQMEESYSCVAEIVDKKYHIRITEEGRKIIESIKNMLKSKFQVTPKHEIMIGDGVCSRTRFFVKEAHVYDIFVKYDEIKKGIIPCVDGVIDVYGVINSSKHMEFFLEKSVCNMYETPDNFIRNTIYEEIRDSIQEFEEKVRKKISDKIESEKFQKEILKYMEDRAASEIRISYKNIHNMGMDFIMKCLHDLQVEDVIEQ